jgi:DNA repair exonuclease SbcCD nuclease subunit
MTDSFRALWTADIHMSNALPHAKSLSSSTHGAGLTDRFVQQLEMWDDIRRHAEENDIENIFALGDIFDKRLLDGVTLTHTIEAIRKLHGVKYVGAGNHEASSTRGGRFNVEVFRTLGDKTIRYMEPGHIQVAPWLRFYWVPFATPEENLKTIKEFQAGLESAAKNVLLIHNSVKGCTHGGWECDDGLDPEEIEEGFDCVLAGHFHDPQDFGRVGMYLGSPMQLNYGDAGMERGFWDIEFFEDGEIKKQFVETSCSKFHVVPTNGIPQTRKLHDPEDDPLKDVLAGDYVRFVVEATPTEWIAIRPKVREAVTKIGEKHRVHASFIHRPIIETTARLEKDARSISYEELVERYRKATAPDDLDPEWLAEIGREALDAAKTATKTIFEGE